MTAWPIRTLSSIFFLCVIIFTIPLAFDVGGRDCGLAFSLSLSAFYFFYSILRIVTPAHSRARWAFGNFISLIQWLVIPILLIWSLNKFSVDSTASGWVEKTFNVKHSAPDSLLDRMFGKGGLLESASIGSWDAFLHYSVPVFQLAEGFCSLLVIQAAGQITRYLVNRDGGDNWMVRLHLDVTAWIHTDFSFQIGLLVVSASIISSAVYFLYRITTFPAIGNMDAILIGSAITCAVFLSAWGIGSGKGNPIESSLLFAYITLCIYQIFTDYKSSEPVIDVPTASQPEFPPLPPMFMATLSTFTHLLSSLPSTMHSAFDFGRAAIMTITPSVIISLAYRVFVMYASTRIIPAVRESGARALSQEPSLEDSDGVGQVVGLVSWFSPSILIAVYTSLLMQHFAANGGGDGGGWWSTQGGQIGGNIWRWANLGGTMLLYATELYLGQNDNDGLTSHWKVD